MEALRNIGSIVPAAVSIDSLFLESARRWERVVFLGEGGTVTFETSPLLLHNQLTLRGSWVCSDPGNERVLQFSARKKLYPEVNVIHTTFPLTEAEKAYELIATGKTGKW